MNLKIEIPKLKVKKNAVVLWQIFLGNDLDVRYGESLEPHFIPYHERITVYFRRLHNTSPLRRVLVSLLNAKTNIYGKDVIEKEFLNGEPNLFYKNASP